MYTYILTQSFWTGTKVIRRKHIVQPTGFGACSSTCCQWDGEDVPAPWERSNSHPPVRVQKSCVNPFIWYNICSRGVCVYVCRHQATDGALEKQEAPRKSQAMYRPQWQCIRYVWCIGAKPLKVCWQTAGTLFKPSHVFIVMATHKICGVCWGRATDGALGKQQVPCGSQATHQLQWPVGARPCADPKWWCIRYVCCLCQAIDGALGNKRLAVGGRPCDTCNSSIFILSITMIPPPPHPPSNDEQSEQCLLSIHML